MEIEFSSLRLRNLIESIRRSIIGTASLNNLNDNKSGTLSNTLEEDKQDLIKVKF